MGLLLLGITLVLYGMNLLRPYLPVSVFAVLFIITGFVLLFESRGRLR
jgi:hypothetical protein